jgi:hypothetical protein
MRLSESLRSLEVSSYQEGVFIGEYSYGFANHVNEDDEKLNTFTIQEEDQRSILIIGGIKRFLPNNQVEANACDESVAEEERQPTETVKEEEMEQTLMCMPIEGDEHSKECLKIFSQEVEQEMIVALKPATEEEIDSMDFPDLYEELESLERRVMVKIFHIQ